ncbi:LysR family transcriptional regulator [Methylobacterium sp.]|jgi:DNA-binding transcriptional LysR family regulator|uniref:LysR family transcriptional regulator n=1 Tax=Methylobacterium sp. TaxID=409 RepID=UPI003B02386F
MLVRHLSFFVTLAREQHFARAAEACNVTQSTLSAAIRKLEEDLQVALVVRNQRFIGLTVEGDCPTSAPVGQNEGLHERRMAGSS